MSNDNAVSWVGTWRNQYGSMLVITDDASGRLKDAFRAALGDSAFAGEEVEIT
jgi:hypothetical protein